MKIGCLSIIHPQWSVNGYNYNGGFGFANQTVDDDFAKKRPKCVNVFKRVLKCQAMPMEQAVLDIFSKYEY